MSIIKKTQYKIKIDQLIDKLKHAPNRYFLLE